MNEVWVITRLFINDDGYEAEEISSVWATEDLAKQERGKLNALPESIDDNFFRVEKWEVRN